MATTKRSALTRGQGGAAPRADGDREGRISGYVLKIIRTSAGLTQDALAEQLGVDTTTVQGWESGRRPLMAVSAGTYLRVRHHLLRVGVSAHLVGQLDMAMEADRFVGYVLGTAGPIDLTGHPLATWVITRPFTLLIDWALTGRAPAVLAEVTDHRRGPTPPGPQLAADERRHLITHLQSAAEQADDSVTGALLRRQAHYVCGFDQSPETVEWLAVMQRRQQSQLRSGGWSPEWAVVRSGAHTLARQGDGEALSRFIGVHITSDSCEVANLNYWAYWLGELADPQTSDTFMTEVDLEAWSGGRILDHLIRQLNPSNPYVDVTAHTVWSLIQLKPESATTRRAGALTTAASRMLEEGSISDQSRQELEEVLYALRIIRR